MKQADAELEMSSSMLNEEELFGNPDTCVITGCDKELDEDFGESGYYSERYVSASSIFCF